MKVYSIKGVKLKISLGFDSEKVNISVIERASEFFHFWESNPREIFMLTSLNRENFQETDFNE